ncbi:MAG TPA: RNA polymerase sigma factor [Thermomicrobiaceae bacterium]|nr:RNA polymerase sigma factor [Thermomicrobiaceae bacterium]
MIETVTFEELIDRHQGEIYAYLLRMVRDDGEAQDLCQDVFLRAYRAYGDLEGTPNYRAWLYRIATNLALNAIRHRRNGERVSGALASLGPTSVDEDHAGDLGRRELLGRVEAAIGTLPLKQRVAFTQRRFLGLSYADIAASTGSTEEAARANVYQAVRKLRAEFSAELNEVGI